MISVDARHPQIPGGSMKSSRLKKALLASIGSLALVLTLFFVAPGTAQAAERSWGAINCGHI